MRGALLALLCVMSVGTVGGSDRDSAGFTAFQSSRPGEIVVRVDVNGQGPFAFLIDTGSSHSAISEPLTRQIGAPLVAQSLIRSSIGLVMRPIARIDWVDIGPVSTPGVLASVVPSAALHPAERIDGIIGQDVLGSRRYTIDLVNRRLVWHHGNERLDGDVALPLEWSSGRFLVALQQDSATLRLVPDSGTQGLVLYRRDRRTPASAMPAVGQIRISTLTSDAEVQAIRLGELRVGSKHFTNLPAAIVDRFDAPAADGDGLLPLHLFSRVTFDSPRRRLIVK